MGQAPNEPWFRKTTEGSSDQCRWRACLDRSSVGGRASPFIRGSVPAGRITQANPVLRAAGSAQGAAPKTGQRA